MAGEKGNDQRDSNKRITDLSVCAKSIGHSGQIKRNVIQRIGRTIQKVKDSKKKKKKKRYRKKELFYKLGEEWRIREKPSEKKALKYT